jgi:hypothetical protein
MRSTVSIDCPLTTSDGRPVHLSYLRREHFLYFWPNSFLFLTRHTSLVCCSAYTVVKLACRPYKPIVPSSVTPTPASYPTKASENPRPFLIYGHQTQNTAATKCVTSGPFLCPTAPAGGPTDDRFFKAFSVRPSPQRTFLSPRERETAGSRSHAR